ncbi:hypothetical protein KCP69_09975 [Salmonella enterica subsp. enterica]|nr:hypothetical protein KCP69_09975 [Salmonella enterica subsp. enterica]
MMGCMSLCLLPALSRSRYDYALTDDEACHWSVWCDGMAHGSRRNKFAAKKLLKAGRSPAAAKRDGIKRYAGCRAFAVPYRQPLYEARSFWLRQFTRAMKQAVIERDIMPVLEYCTE